MKIKSWVPSGVVLVYIVLTANSVENQDIRSNKGISEDEKFDYKDTESSIGDYEGKSITKHKYVNNADKDDCEGYCDNSGECEIGKDGERSCKCKKGTSGSRCWIVDGCANDYCGPNKDAVYCEYDENTMGPHCRCRDSGKIYSRSKKECRKTCDETSDCKNEGTCTNEKVCDCKPGTSGEICEIIDACKDGKYKSCKGEYGECTFEAGKAVCTCKDGKKLDETKGQCRKQCDVDSDCKNNGKCIKNEGGLKFCACESIYTGDKCEKITECEEDGKYQSCRGENGECKLENGAAVCNCPEGKVLDKNAGYCKYKYCYPNPCRDGAVCFYDKKTDTGTCNCTSDRYYYDFSEFGQNACKASDPDRCILTKKTCGENEKCESGYCHCIDNYKRVGHECKPDLCASNPCFSGAICDDTDGILKCSCGEGKYFDGEKCADGSCFLGDYKATCKEPCPENMERKGKDKPCEPVEGFTLCSDSCGYGYCLQKKGEKSMCSCISSISHNLYRPKDGDCVLKSEVVCPAKLYNQYSYQCNCTGKYKRSSNDITCELKTCLDESAQKDCKERGTRCVNDGKQGYICECPQGYVMDEKRKMCTDPCSLEEKRKQCLDSDQLCYNTLQTWNQQTKRNEYEECRCPPALKEVVTRKDTWNSITECKDLAENSYIVTGIPVIKKRYEVQHKMKINEVLLNTDLINAMKSTFWYFDYGYLLDYELNGDVLNVSVWMQLRYEISQQLNRIRLQAKSVNCDDCAWDLSLWPPNVLLDTKLLSGVKMEPIKFCSEKTKDFLCGKDAVCQDNKCSCPRGFKTVYPVKETDKFRIEHCEDIDECALGAHSCSSNTTCVNVPGDYYCQCKANYKKEDDTVHSRIIKDKSDCYDLCTPNPCNNGTCMLKEDKSFDCKCPIGYVGSFCDTADVNLAKSEKSNVVTAAILGTLFGLTLVALIALILLYIRLKNNNSHLNNLPSTGRR